MTVTTEPIRAGEVLPERIDVAPVAMAAWGLGIFCGGSCPTSRFHVPRPGGGGT